VQILLAGVGDGTTPSATGQQWIFSRQRLGPSFPKVGSSDNFRRGEARERIIRGASRLIVIRMREKVS
jgi:hypothetical protein